MLSRGKTSRITRAAAATAASTSTASTASTAASTATTAIVAIVAIVAIIAIAGGALIAPQLLHGQFFNTGFHWSNFGPFTVPARLSAIFQDPRSTTTLLEAAPGGGLWRSVDGGNTWSVLTDNAPASQICTMAVDPNNPDNIFLGTGDDQSLRANPGVLHTPDGGNSWTFVAGFSTNALCALAIDPTNSKQLVAGSLNGVYRSTDNGVTWTQTSGVATQSIAFDPATAGVVYAANYQPTFLTGFGSQVTPLLKSLDGGMTWTQLSFSPPGSTDFRTFQRASVAVGDAGAIYFANSYLIGPTGGIDVYSSMDAGMTWTLAQNVATITNGSHLPLVWDTINKALYVGGATLLRSTAAAQAFTAVKYTSIGNIEAMSLSLNTTPQALLIAGDYGAASIPLSGVTTANPAVALGNPPVGIFASLSLDPSGSGIIYVSGEDGLQIYTPLLGSWRRAVSSAVGFTVATNSNPVNVWSMGNLLFNNSANGGTTFKTVTAITANEPRAPYPPMLVTTVGGTTVIYTAGERFYRSTDSGSTFNPVGMSTIDTAGGVVTALAVSPTISSSMFAAAACLPTTNALTTACPASSRIYMSTNSGGTWTRLTTVNGFVSKLAVDPLNPAVVYAAIGAFPGGPNPAAGLVAGDLVLVRNNGGTTGVTATSLKANLPDGPINAISFGAAGGGGVVIGQALTQTFYVGTDNGVFGTSNGGTSWVSLASGLPNVPITDLEFQTGGTLRAATYGRGLFIATLPTGALTPTVTPLGGTVTVREGQSATLPFTVTNSSTTPIDFTIQLNDAFLSTSSTTGHLESSGSSSVVLLTVNAANLTPGTYSTTFQIVRSANTTFTTAFSQDFHLSLNVGNPPAALSAIAGNGLTAPGGSQVTLTAQATDVGAVPLSGVTVQFAIQSGGGSLSSGTAVTNSLGNASTTLTLPASSAGKVTVTATASGLTAMFAVNSVVVPQPTLNSGAAVNAASFIPGGALAPGAIFSLFGTQFASAVTTASTVPLPTTLGGVQVLLGTTAVPLFVVSQTQINAQVPFEAPIGTAQLSVQVLGSDGVTIIPSNAIPVIVNAASPGIFTLAASGTGAGVFIKPDSSLVSAQNPAKRGLMVTFYATGLGAVTNAPATGAAAPSAPNLSVVAMPPGVNVNIGGVDAVVQFAGLAPGFVGLYQINAIIPSSVAPETNVPVTLRVGTALSNTVTLAIN